VARDPHGVRHDPSRIREYVAVDSLQQESAAGGGGDDERVVDVPCPQFDRGGCAAADPEAPGDAEDRLGVVSFGSRQGGVGRPTGWLARYKYDITFISETTAVVWSAA